VKYLPLLLEDYMKKIISFLVVLCITASVFALGSIRVGGAFSLVTGRTKPFLDGQDNTIVRYTSSGFGMNVLGKDDLSDNIAMWLDFGITFGSTGKIKNYNDPDWKTIDQMADEFAAYYGGIVENKKLYSLSAAGGVMYKLPFTNTRLSYAVGGGLFIDRLFAEITAKITYDGHTEGQRVRSFNVGLTSYGEVSKQFSDHFGISMTLMLRMGILNFSAHTMLYNGKVDDGEIRAIGFAPSFSMPVVLGVTYYF
jgi:hypothetical protein